MRTVPVSGPSRRMLELAHQCMSRALQLDYLSTGSGHQQTTPLRTLRAVALSPGGLRARSGRNRDIIRQYLTEVAGRKRLTSSEEYCLATSARDGSRQARGRLIEHHLGLVVMMARRYRNCGLPLLDLIAEGNLGLIKAVARFDPERGYRFSTYAKWWVRQAIELALMTQAATVHVPVHITRQLRRQSRIGTTGRLLHDTRNHADAGGDTQHDDLSGIVNRVAAPEDEQPDSYLQLAHRRKQLETALTQLRQTEQWVLRSRYGLIDGTDRTLQCVSRQLNVSPERVRQIQAEALGKLRQILQADGTLDREALL